jgi:hypothetical protein
MMRVADYHFNHRNWTEAAEAYDHFVQIFRNSGGVPYATLQAARASFLAYRGAQFDETPLLNAEQRFKIFREHYPAQAAKANISDTLREIRELRATKLYSTAEFYQRIGHPIPQAYYDEQVALQFPQTPQAARAVEEAARLGELKPPPPAPAPQSRPFTPPPPEPTASAPTSAPAAGPIAQGTGAQSRPASRPTSGPVRLEELVPTSQGVTTTPASEPRAASQATSAPATTSSAPASGPSGASAGATSRPSTSPTTAATTRPSTVPTTAPTSGERT